jgi:uncharacterized surface protein with fasciclin (FAS1) repeats
MKVSSSFASLIAILLVQALAPLTSKADIGETTWRGQSITGFSPDENKILDWKIVNDGVMGGLSEGNLEFADDNKMKFFGELSLKNNGGFTTARSADISLNLSNDLGLLLLVKGDGRTYQARLDSDARFRGATVSFASDFTTRKGEWQQIKLPFSEFKGSFRGTDLPNENLNPAAIERVWILLGDKKEGPFSLEIDWIQTYGKGQGNYTETKTQDEGKKPVRVAAADSAPSKLIDTAVADGRFTVFKKALDAAGLTPFFQWDNKLTVFAPTDEAFAKVPKGTLEALLKPENKQKLVALLSSHVSPGDHRLAELLSGGSLDMIKGGPIRVNFTSGDVRINGSASVVDADIECTDGVIHVIDSVLLPSADS